MIISLWQRLFQQALEVCPTSVAEEARCIISYCTVPQYIVGPLQRMFIWSSICMPAHSDFLMYVNLHGQSAHESQRFLLLLP